MKANDAIRQASTFHGLSEIAAQLSPLSCFSSSDSSSIQPRGICLIETPQFNVQCLETLTGEIRECSYRAVSSVRVSSDSFLSFVWSPLYLVDYVVSPCLLYMSVSSPYVCLPDSHLCSRPFFASVSLLAASLRLCLPLFLCLPLCRWQRLNASMAALCRWQHLSPTARSRMPANTNNTHMGALTGPHM